MKKLFSILMTFVFVLSLGTVALAGAVTLPEKTLPGTEIPKSFEPLNANRLSGEQTFAFSFTQNSPAAENPTENLTTVAIPITTISYDEGIYGDKTGAIDLSAFSSTEVPVGRYTYVVEELVPSPKVAGMVYTTRKGMLFVDKESDGTVKSYLIIGTVGTDPTKKFNNFNNIFEAGDLHITKEVTGNLGDLTKEFSFTVTLTAPDDPDAVSPAKKTIVNGIMKLYKNGVPTVPATEVTFNAAGSATVTFDLSDGETFTIKNLPYGVTYLVEETDPMEGYSVTTNGVSGRTASGEIDNTLKTVDVVNHKSSEIPTGIALDSLPYILILGFTGIGMGVLFFRKRHAF